MDFSFTPEQDELAALTRRILEDAVAGGAAPSSGYDTALTEKLAAADVLGVALPTDVGGGGYGLIEQCRVLVEVGRAVAPVPVLPSIAMGAMAIAEFGTAEQKRTWVEPAAAGRTILTAALTEELNYDATAPATHAELTSAGWRINGEKTTVPAVPDADLILVPARTSHGVTVFLISSQDAGVVIEPQHTTGEDPQGWMGLTDVTVAEDRVLGRVGQGAAIAQWIAQRTTVGLCALQLGVTERALELTAEYAREREQFERPIGTFQAVAQRLADAYVDVAGIRLSLWQAAWLLSEELPSDLAIATAKFWAADGGHRVAHTAVHIHGGTGIALDYPVHRYFTAAKSIEFALGGATEQLRRIGATLATP